MKGQWALLGLLALMFVACGSSPTPTPSPAPQDEQVPVVPSKSTLCPKLESALHELARSPDPAKDAAGRGLHYETGLVRVVIDLNQPDATLPEQHQVKIEKRGRLQIRALVPLEKLCALSEEGVVDFVHAPVAGVPN